MRHAVEQKYFDDGTVKVWIREAEENEESYQYSQCGHDHYVDIFQTPEEAKQFVEDAENA